VRVREVMTQGVECISPDTTLKDAAARMSSLNIGPLPVCEEDRLVGMLTDRDITVRATARGSDPNTTPVREAMTPEVLFCFEDDDVKKVADLMREKQVRRLLVLNQGRRLTGIVSLGDLATHTGDERLAGETLEGVSQPTEPARR
jgi:CBS domain-containing protein